MHMVRQATLPQAPRIVIVGAGASGLALAAMLHGLDAEVTVVEQVLPPGRPDTFPGIVSGADLRTLGIAPESLGARLITRVTYADDGSGHTPDRFPSSWWATEHGALLAALKSGLGAGGITMLPAVTVTGFAWHGGGIAGVRTAIPGQVIPADLVVLADESDPRLAEQLGLRPDWPPTALAHIGKEFYPASAETIRARFEDGAHGSRIVAFQDPSSWGSPGYGLLIPGRDAIVIVVTMLLEDEMLHSRHIREYLDEVERAPAVRDVMEGLTPTRFFTEVIPIGGFDARHRFHADRVLVVNDLVGVTHPLNRDGFSANLGMCLAAAGTIRDAVRLGDFGVTTLAAYSRQLEREIAGHVDAERRRERSRRGQPAWQWASKPELVSPAQGMTAREKSGTLPTGDVWGRLRGLGRRTGVHRHAPGEYDE